MKKALNRVLAAVAALPIALTQGLAVVTNAEVVKETIDVDYMLYIDPAETESRWGEKIDGALFSMEGAKKLIDLKGIVSELELAGKQSEYAERVMACMVGDPVVTVNGNVVTVTGQVDATTEAQRTVIATIKEALTQQGAAEIIDSIDFSILEKKGTYTAVANGVDVASSKSFIGGGQFVDEDGNVVTPSTAKAYVMGLMQDISVEITAKAAQAGLTVDLTDLMASYQSKIDKAYEYLDKAVTAEYSESFASMDEAFAWAYEKKESKTDRFASMPSSVADLMNYSDTLDKVVAEVNAIVANSSSTYSLGINMADITEVLAEASNVEATASAGVYTVTFQISDAEAADVEVAYEEANPDREYVSSYKIVTVEGDITEQSVYFNVERIIEDKEKDVTTTSTSDTTDVSTGSDVTTTTTVSGSGSDSSTTTTTVSGSGSDSSTTTTTVSGSGSDSSTTTTTVSGSGSGSDSSTTTTSTSVSGGSDSSTTTTSTSYNPVGTTVLEIEVKDAGFFFSVDERTFNPADLFEKFEAVDENGTHWDLLSYPGAVTFGGANPKSLYDATGEAYCIIDVPTYFTDPKDNTATVQIEQTPKAYIGVKGDTNLSAMVQVEDAVAVLTYYAQASANLDPSFIADDELLNKLAYFLSDVDTESKLGENNLEAQAMITVEDAVNILTYYAQQSAALEPVWPDVIPSLTSLEGSMWYVA